MAPSNRRSGRVVAAVVGALLVVSGIVVLKLARRASPRATTTVQAEIGIPELYARPIAADVDGDGVEDMIVVTAIENGAGAREDDEVRRTSDQSGRFDALVQAIDGKNGTVLYSLAQGPAYSSLGADAKSSPRIVLVAGKDRLGVARVPQEGNASITIHELATGKELASLSFEPSSGRACEYVSGPARFPNRFLFERSGNGTSGTVIDLERATAKAASSSCGDYTTPNVADVPADSITNRTAWEPRFSPEIELRKGAGPYGGNMIVVARSGVGFLVTGEKAEEQPSVEANVPVDAGGGLRPKLDNTKIELVGLDVAAGTTRFVRSLASLGFATQVVDHVEVIERGALLFFEGADGLALVDAEHGDKVWSLPLPDGHRLSSYTLSKTRAYLHVFGPDSESHGVVSKKLGSRILVVDLATGSSVRSVPDGPLHHSADAGSSNSSTEH
ncbi:MAG: hypothetical protein BGO98_38790 [Myxococcales bacterium 68-20]|nr:hypothetical protein [Myxococcales bacterium]OJY26314.1 MAG: hypothetical protein BGO98_38790 [Myxococcales bacterium 68-20]